VALCGTNGKKMGEEKKERPAPKARKGTSQSGGQVAKRRIDSCGRAERNVGMREEGEALNRKRGGASWGL